ncbi:MAG TPA: zf-HC2 domain-containing protein [Myxococcota bacterium]|nr:zf-HC2 domain-containing protein [Myxococcota bacterium]HRY95333.1 zf-HC2 domain-containing protein [Myxococcota bacterium]HSA24369.1 zf-HC2 domain-containing protein [Myxococcota bacterium]
MDDTRDTRCLVQASPEELSALLDGDLEPARAAELAAHLDRCPACCQIAAELGAVRGGLRALGDADRAEAAQARDLWADIRRERRREVRAERGEGQAWWRRYWLAPAGALLGAAAAALVLWLVFVPGPQTGRAPVEALTAVLDAERTYQLAIAGLEGSLAQPQAGYDSETQRTIRQGLADIDTVIERCREALRASPDDLGAHRAMLAAYQHKVDFLSDLVGEAL